MLVSSTAPHTLTVIVERHPPAYRARLLDGLGDEAATPFTAGGSELQLDATALADIAGAGGNGGAARAAGLRLFERLFTGGTLDMLRAAQAAAERQGSPLRILVQLAAAPELEAVPWECLYDPGRVEFLAVAGSIVRHVQHAGQPAAALAGPLRVVAVAPSVGDAPWFDAERELRTLRASVAPLTLSGAFALERLDDASEAGLQRRLAGAPCHVLHVIGWGQCNLRAQRATLVLRGQGGGGREVTAQRLGSLLQSHPALRLVVLETRSGASVAPCDPAVAARLLVQHGVAASIALRGRPDARERAVHDLYAALASGASADEALTLARRRIRESAGDVQALASIVYVRWPDVRAVAAVPAAQVLESREQPAVGPGQLPTSGPDVGHVPLGASTGPTVAAPIPSARERAALEIALKREHGEFDVFLCHKGSDKPLVRRIGERLLERGILPWLDEWELRPGLPWIQLLERQIGRIRTAAVFVGPDGLGPWQRQEIDALLREFVERQAPVIPVLLENAPREPELPLFLRGLTWVDFRTADQEPLERLIWGITGTRTSR
jgi:hypothetical protein